MSSANIKCNWSARRMGAALKVAAYVFLLISCFSHHLFAIQTPESQELHHAKESKSPSEFQFNMNMLPEGVKANAIIPNFDGRSARNLRQNKRELAGQTDAYNSVVSGISTTINALTTYTVTVTAKDSSGSNIGHGGDKFWIQIYNQCTMTDEFTCTQVSGAKQTIVTPVDQLMTDVGDGTYTYSFSVQINGALTIIIKLIDAGGVYAEWYPNTLYSPPTEKVNI